VGERASPDGGALEPEILLPGHGFPVIGAARVREALLDTARYLESLYEQTRAAMNQGATLYEILEHVRPPAELAAKPFLKPVYDEPDFIVRNVYRCLGGWYSGVPSELKPAPRRQQAREIASLAGGVGRLLARARECAADGDLTIACHLVDRFAEAEPRAARCTGYAQRCTDAGPSRSLDHVEESSRHGPRLDGAEAPASAVSQRPRAQRGAAERSRSRPASSDGEILRGLRIACERTATISSTSERVVQSGGAIATLSHMARTISPRSQQRVATAAGKAIGLPPTRSLVPGTVHSSAASMPIRGSPRPGMVAGAAQAREQVGPDLPAVLHQPPLDDVQVRGRGRTGGVVVVGERPRQTGGPFGDWSRIAS
jgi:hypothetical protein